ncbi:MAG: glycoside hydrolase family 43 protein [Clostridia bacterium]|nr:glycoside hydrolase family 43 protein [Clostridia bacterium]
MKTIKNPILKGFNPDPSIIRVGEDYYIATSTFEWFPGVQIHHSKDLINWELIARPLSRVSQLDMLGIPDSGGVWAPCLSYDNGIFYLIYSIEKNTKGLYQDVHNYLVTASDIRGEWSEPVYLNSDGFDPSLFHDDDGRKWLVNMTWDPRRGKPWFGGIRLTELDAENQKLKGIGKVIFTGTELGVTEGPHIIKRNGMYYLITAEGGTSLGHCVTIARSENIDGPYEVDPENPVLTSKEDITLPLQKAGHCDIVETQNGDWYMVHLSGRPIPVKGKCILGRETSIQKVYWTDNGWLRLANGTNKPDLIVEAPELEECIFPKAPERDDFDSEKLDINFQTLRRPLSEDDISLTERVGWLRIKGREWLSSQYHQSLVARRQQAFCCSVETYMEFNPKCFKHMAGLVCYYDTNNFYYLYVTLDDEGNKVLDIISYINNFNRYPLKEAIKIPNNKGVGLKAEIEYDKLVFSYAVDGKWHKTGCVLDQSLLSDEACCVSSIGCFTGAFIGLCCQDVIGTGVYADFDYFEYKEKPDKQTTV